MSAGIIVMNKNAIAMAADSAVTIGDHAAIHNSANKLFALSMFEPVGAIIYANAQFMQVPMEIIIKQYKTELGKKNFSTLQEYVDDFVSFLERNSDLFHFRKNEENYVLGICFDLLQGLANGYTNRAKELIGKVNRPLTEKEDIAIKQQALEETMQFVDSQPIVRDSFSSYVENVYLEKIVGFIERQINWVTDRKELAMKLCRLFDTHFTRRGYMGMAIAGYGKSEIFPHMVHLKLSGILNGKLRYEKVGNMDIDEIQTAAIIPLAQTDVMHTFIRGYNDLIMQQVAGTVPQLIGQRIDTMPNSTLDDGQKKQIKESFVGFQNDVAKIMQEVANNVFVSPIIDSVTSLPIEELALFAESMINITSVRRRVAIDGNIGTVGGPIDVAIVTRGDGLIWLKRKHYFEAKKNPQFMYSRYGQPIQEVITNEDE